jgi:PAS domain S-box-containing protein
MGIGAYDSPDLLSATVALLQRPADSDSALHGSRLNSRCVPFAVSISTNACCSVARRLLFRFIDDDSKQALRMRHYFIAAGTSLLVLAILLASHLQGMFSRIAFLQTSALIILAVLGFYIIFRSGLNLKFSDPSLTLPQMSVATVIVLHALYMAGSGRGVFLIVLLMIFLFGVLRLATQALLAFALFILVGYGAVIALSWRFEPQRVDISMEFLQWLVLAATLPWFALMGGYLSRLRQRLRNSRAEQQVAFDTLRASEARLEEAQRIARLGSWTFDRERWMADWSPETYRILGVDLARPAPVGEEFLKLVHPQDRRHYAEQVWPALREGRRTDNHYRIVLPDGEVRWIHSLGKPGIDAQGQRALLHGTVMDVTERKELELRQAMEHSVTRILAESDVVSDAMPRVLQTIGDTLGWDCGARWYRDVDSGVLRCAETWSIASAEIRAFVESSAKQAFAPAKAGLIRRAWTSAEAIWIADVRHEPGFLRSAMAVDAGLRSAFAFPISKGFETLGVMEFNTRDVRKPDPALLQVTRSIGQQIAQFMARKDAEERLRQLAHFDFLTGLPNRNMFNQLLAHALAKAQGARHRSRYSSSTSMASSRLTIRSDTTPAISYSSVSRSGYAIACASRTRSRAPQSPTAPRAWAVTSSSCWSTTLRACPLLRSSPSASSPLPRSRSIWRV